MFKNKTLQISALGNDCWSNVFDMLCESDRRTVYSLNIEFKNQVLLHNQRHLNFALSDNQTGSTSIPSFVTKLICPTMQWSSQWLDCIGFHSARLSQQDAEAKSKAENIRDIFGWICDRPLHKTETDIMAQIQHRHCSIVSLTIKDKRPNWTFWDSLSIHPKLVEFIFSYCKCLENLHIEHFSLSSQLSLQNTKYGFCHYGLPNLKTLRLLDTILDRQLMQFLIHTTVKLECVHINKIGGDVSKEDFIMLFEALPQLRNICIGHSYRHGMRDQREVQCKSCVDKNRVDVLAHHQAQMSARKFSICIRDNIDLYTCDALLAACGQGTIESFHLYGLVSERHMQTDTVPDEAVLLNRILVKSLAEENAKNLRNLHLSAGVGVKRHQLTAICNCQGLECLTIKSSLRKDDLELICTNLRSLRYLSFSVSQSFQVITDAGLHQLQQLDKLEILQITVRGAPFTKKWFCKEFNSVSKDQVLSNEGLAGLTKCKSLRVLYLGNTPFMGNYCMLKSPPTQSEEELLSLAEWICKSRRKGIDHLQNVLKDRCFCKS
jgi:hypothetical protein